MMPVEKERKVRALAMCKKFLGGSWNNCEIDNFVMEPIRGALTNYIYLCQLNDKVTTEDHEYRKVLLRIYGEISGPHEKFYELLIFNVLSERKLGPRLLGAFKIGRIEEYIPSRPLSVYELRNGQYLVQIARKMAKYHLMEVPFTKRPSFINRYASRYIPFVNKAIHERTTMSEERQKIIDEVIRMNIIQEYEELYDILTKSSHTVVFCHNDVQEGNLLLKADVTGEYKSSDITLIDYEYSYYGYRGYDIGNHFCEWVLQNVADTPAGYDYDINAYPTHEQQLKFADAYLNCISEELKDAPESKRKYFLTTPEDFIREANEHSLMSHLLWGFWGFAQHYLSHIEFDFWDYSITRFRLYFQFKQKFYPKRK